MASSDLVDSPASRLRTSDRDWTKSHWQTSTEADGKVISSLALAKTDTLHVLSLVVGRPCSVELWVLEVESCYAVSAGLSGVAIAAVDNDCD